MGKLKVITHIYAVIAAAFVAFVATPAGQALLHQYPILSAIAGVIGAGALAYHNPRAV